MIAIEPIGKSHAKKENAMSADSNDNQEELSKVEQIDRQLWLLKYAVVCLGILLSRVKGEEIGPGSKETEIACPPRPVGALLLELPKELEYMYRDIQGKIEEFYAVLF
jgi:hypothetical protein